jgi:hypothetical protein
MDVAKDARIRAIPSARAVAGSRLDTRTADSCVVILICTLSLENASLVQVTRKYNGYASLIIETFELGKCLTEILQKIIMDAYFDRESPI